MKLEKKYQQAYMQYYVTKSQDALRELIELLEPTIKRGFYYFGQGLPALYGKAKLLAKDAIETYDPKKGPLETHVLLTLQRLQRLAPRVSNIVSVPEARRMLNIQLQEATKELEDKYGRPPSDQELADYLGLSLKKIENVRQAQGAAAESVFQGNVATTESQRTSQAKEKLWMETVYKSLSPIQQKIMEGRYGLFGNRPKTLQEIADELNISTTGVHAHLARIDEILNKGWKL